jgi:acyl-coenzyme A thioesterase PaaI-like protein
MEKAIQDLYAPRGVCFGCGTSNDKGLRIKSDALSDDECVCEWTPEKHHEAFPGVLSGGIIGTLLDCHSNWTACYHIMKNRGATEAPSTVTANYAVKLTRPCPTGAPVKLRAWVTESTDKTAKVSAELEAGGKICATCEGFFVAVEEGHPAFHRW